ncbi:MAG: ATP-binding protein [Clostridia bacterium]|nr:ATP-binding protein [Clostridia bacterium]
MADNVHLKTLTLPLSGRIDSNNANTAESELRSALSGRRLEELILDASELRYISSAGLRVLLRIKKDVPELTIINAAPEVYEILEMTGFTEIMTIEKAYRAVSVEGCEQIGRGANGSVYRIGDDNVVKVYSDPEALDEIRSEREKARLALVLGLPTAISYEVVKVGESYGSVFELLNARSFSSILANEPERFGWCVKEFSGLLKKIHSVVVPEGKLPDIKQTVLEWAEQTASMLPAAEGEKLLALIRAVPERPNMIHGDYHTKNIMLQNDEVLLIDMDTLSVGDPVFEWGQIFNSFIGFHEVYPDGIKAFQGFDAETGERFFRAALASYLGTECEHKLKEVTDKARIIGYPRLISRLKRHNMLDTERGAAEAERWIGELLELLSSAKTLTFTPNELILPAERENLDETLRFIGEHIAMLEPSAKTQMQLDVAAEEIFINICDYAYSPGKGNASIRIDTDPEAKEACITFEDRGTPYDPIKREDPDVSLPVGERAPGGLGVFLAKKLTDDIRYEYREGKNILYIRKKM